MKASSILAVILMVVAGAASAQGNSMKTISLENTVIAAELAASAGDLGTMRAFAMRPFEGGISVNPGGRVVAPAADRAEIKKDIHPAAVPGPAGEDLKKDIASTPKPGKPGLASVVPVPAKGEKADKEAKGDLWQLGIKLLIYGAVAAAAALIVGGAIAGAVAFGVPGAVAGLAIGAVVTGVIAVKVLQDFWNHF